MKLHGSSLQCCNFDPCFSPSTCTYANCVKAPLAVFPSALPEHVNRRDYLEQQSRHYQSIVKMEDVSSDDLRANFTLIHFITKQDGKRIDICGVFPIKILTSF